MRIIDIAAAASFSLLSIALLITLNPLDVRRQTQSLVADSIATTTLLSYLGTHDLHYLATSDLSQICETIATWNNPSRAIDLTVNGIACNPSPERGAYPGHSEFIVLLPGKSVEVDAWAR